MTTCNGWRNYATWNVKLWIDNDQGSQEYWQEAAEEAYKATDEDDEESERIDDASRELAERLESETDEACPKLEGCFADLMSHALGQVDWDEIATSMIEDAVESLKD